MHVPWIRSYLDAFFFIKIRGIAAIAFDQRNISTLVVQKTNGVDKLWRFANWYWHTNSHRAGIVFQMVILCFVFRWCGCCWMQIVERRFNVPFIVVCNTVFCVKSLCYVIFLLLTLCFCLRVSTSKHIHFVNVVPSTLFMKWVEKLFSVD